MSETLTHNPPPAEVLPPVPLPDAAADQARAAEAAGQPGGGVPQEFQDIATLLQEETELAARDTLKQQAAEAITPTLDALSPEEVPDFLAQVNETYAGVFSGEDLRLLSASRDRVIIVDTHGELVEVEITAENCRDVLAAVKRADLETNQGHSYRLRSEIMKRSDGVIPSHEAYTYAEEIPASELDSYLDNPDSWIPARRAIHEAMITGELGQAHELSERLDDKTPTLYALRGNTAAGKTTAVRSEPTFAKALDETGEPTGSINPDTYKAMLREIEERENSQIVSTSQLHEEGSMIARQITARLKASESSMVIDKRMAKEKNLSDLIRLAEESGREVKILDVDVPLEISLVRVLGREVGGASPNVPFDAVAEGFRDIRANRASVLRTAREDEKIVEYVLRVADETGVSVEVARKTGPGIIEVVDGREELLKTSLDSDSTAEEVKRLAETVITDEYIEDYIGRAHAEDPTGRYAQAARAALSRYKGKTLKEALDARSMDLGESKGE